MKKYILLGIIFLSMNALIAKTTWQSSQEDKITGAITAKTTEKELEDLITFLQKHHIKLSVKNQKRNKAKEITGITLKIQHEQQQNKQQQKQQQQYAVSSNSPIPNLELGAENGQLFIHIKEQKKTTEQQKHTLNNIPSGGAINDMLAQLGLDLTITDKNSIMSFNGQTLNLDKLHEQMMEAFNSEEVTLADFFQQTPSVSTSKNNLPKYSFINQPGINKLIIIDGKETSFASLDQLAKSDQLEVVDFLKSDTATSIYGDKAKDGAIIATTKK